MISLVVQFILDRIVLNIAHYIEVRNWRPVDKDDCKINMVEVQQFKAWFSYVSNIPDDRGFYFLPTIPDNAGTVYRIFARGLSQIFLIMNLAGNGKCAKNRNLNTNATAFQQFGGLVMIADHCRNLGCIGK